MGSESVKTGIKVGALAKFALIRLPKRATFITLVEKDGVLEENLFVEISGGNSSKFLGSVPNEDVIFLRNNTGNIPKITEEVVHAVDRNVILALEEKNRSLKRQRILHLDRRFVLSFSAELGVRPQNCIN